MADKKYGFALDAACMTIDLGVVDSMARGLSTIVLRAIMVARIYLVHNPGWSNKPGYIFQFGQGYIWAGSATFPWVMI
jgi:hypothetical protein